LSNCCRYLQLSLIKKIKVNDISIININYSFKWYIYHNYQLTYPQSHRHFGNCQLRSNTFSESFPPGSVHSPSSFERALISVTCCWREYTTYRELTIVRKPWSIGAFFMLCTSPLKWYILKIQSAIGFYMRFINIIIYMNIQFTGINKNLKEKPWTNASPLGINKPFA